MFVDAARARPAALELAETLPARAGSHAAGRRGHAPAPGRRLRMARMLLRWLPAKTGAVAGIRRGRRQNHWRLREEGCSRSRVSRRIGRPMAWPITAQKQFPQRYQGGLFIAFHGSWNRAPYPQGGYNVVYQPLAGEHAGGACEIFADGFAGAVKSPDKARPSPQRRGRGAGRLAVYLRRHPRTNLQSCVSRRLCWRRKYHSLPERDGAGRRNRSSRRQTSGRHASGCWCGYCWRRRSAGSDARDGHAR